MRALIVDDEPLARRGIVLRLKKFKDVEIVGECEDGSSAVERILTVSPDVVFLDVQMPGMDGFEVLRTIPKENLPSVIFLTAYDRFRAALQRARMIGDHNSKLQMAERLLQMLQKNAKQYISRFPVRVGSRIRIVLADEIEWIAAAGDYAELHGSGRSHLIRETMNSLEGKLDPAQFFRIHRSRIVRAKCIRELCPIDNREYLVKLSDGSEHRSSRGYADHLDSWLTSAKR